MKNLFKGFLALALVLTLASSITLIPNTEQGNDGTISTQVFDDWDLFWPM